MSKATRAADVIVIGGGVVGSAATYYLSVAGLDVVLCEMRDIAGGTSGACDGNILAIDKMPGYDSQMTFKSQELLEDLARELPYDFEYRRLGSTLAVANDAEMEVARDWVSRQQAAGLPIELMDRGEIHDDAPQLAPDIVGGVVCHSDSSLYPMGLAYGLVEAAKEAGARVLTCTEVTGIKRDGSGGAAGVETSRGDIAARHVVLAAGVWTPCLAESVGVNLPIQPRKGHILVAERGREIYWRKIMEFGYLMAKFGGGGRSGVEPDMEKFGVALVFEPTPAGNFLVGSSREFVGFDTRCDGHILRLMARRAIRFFPAIAGINVIRSYAGLRPYTADHLPIVSPVRQVPRLYVAAGHEGDGIGLAPVTGQLVTAFITGQSPPIDPAPLSLDRFEDDGVANIDKESTT